MKRFNYRKYYQKYHNLTNEEMKGMDIHHIDGDHSNNDISNLALVTPQEHAKLHQHEFVEWARIGSKLGNAAFIKRRKEKGLTEKELAYREKRIEVCKKGLHQVPHSEETKKIISEKKKEFYKDKTNHPMWGNTTYKIKSPTGENYIIEGGIKQWCEERKINASNLRLVALGKRKHTKGYTAEIIK